MKKEMKRVNKKALIMPLVLLGLIILGFVLVAAAEDTSSGDSSFFQRWVDGNLKDFQAKMLLLLMIFIVLLILLQSLGLGTGSAILLSIPASFILTIYVTPESVVEVFKSYETLPLVFATFLPLAVLFAFTYLSVVKGSRTLMTTQWLLWLIFLCYLIIRIGLSLWVYNELSYSEYFALTITLPPEAESFWYWSSIIVQAIVAFIMVVGAGSFMNWALKKTVGLEDAAAARKFRQASFALKHLADVEKDLAK